MNCKIKHYGLTVDEIKSTLFVIIDLDGEIIGSCMVFKDGLIQDFHVSEKFRGVGFGSALLKKVEETAKGIIILSGLVQHENSALRFWLKKGFSSCRVPGGWRIKKEISNVSNLKKVFDDLEWKSKNNGLPDLSREDKNRVIFTEKDWKLAKRKLARMSEYTPNDTWNHVFFGVDDGNEKLVLIKIPG